MNSNPVLRLLAEVRLGNPKALKELSSVRTVRRVVNAIGRQAGGSPGYTTFSLNWSLEGMETVWLAANADLLAVGDDVVRNFLGELRREARRQHSLDELRWLIPQEWRRARGGRPVGRPRTRFDTPMTKRLGENLEELTGYTLDELRSSIARGRVSAGRARRRDALGAALNAIVPLPAPPQIRIEIRDGREYRVTVLPEVRPPTGRVRGGKLGLGEGLLGTTTQRKCVTLLEEVLGCDRTTLFRLRRKYVMATASANLQQKPEGERGVDLSAPATPVLPPGVNGAWVPGNERVVVERPAVPDLATQGDFFLSPME